MENITEVNSENLVNIILISQLTVTVFFVLTPHMAAAVLSILWGM